MFDFRRTNVPILLLSFALSLLLWMHVKSLSEAATPPSGPSVFNVNLELRNQPAGTVVVGDVPSSIPFTALGPTEEQRKINPDYLKAFIDLSEKPPDGRFLVRLETTAEYKVNWRPTNLKLPVKLEQEISKRIEVKVEAIGDFKIEGYKYDGVTSDPSVITVTGASSQVEKVKLARAYFNLAAIGENNAQRAKVELLDEKESPVSDVAMSTDTVTVSAVIAPRPPRRSFIIQPNWTGAPEFGSTVADYEFTPAQVMVEGPADILANLSVINTKPINIDGLKETAVIPVELVLPQGIRLSNPQEVSVKVFIKGPGPQQPPASTTGGQ
jgi:YbbR domain-containing protein